MEDGTVRNSLGEFAVLDGSDGMHPARVERVKMPILKKPAEHPREVPSS